MQTGGVEFTAFTFLLSQKSAVFSWKTAQLALMRPGMWFHSSQDRRHHHCSPPLNFPCCFPSNGQHLGGVPGPYRLARLLHSVSPPLSTLRVYRDSRSSESLPGSPARMEGDDMDKVEATTTVRDFDPISGSIPATKVEITVSCRWVRVGWNRSGLIFFFWKGGTSERFGCVFAFGKHTTEISCYFFFNFRAET